jgi:cysteine synthase A
MVGNTPLVIQKEKLTCAVLEFTPFSIQVRIKSLSDATGCNIYGKAEYLNPSGSVKDRAAVNMVDLAMRSGLIKRGDVVCEATGGNTGVSLALVSASQGFRTILCMTAGVSKEKQDLMRLYGAEIVLCPPGSFSLVICKAKFSSPLRARSSRRRHQSYKLQGDS